MVAIASAGLERLEFSNPGVHNIEPRGIINPGFPLVPVGGGIPGAVRLEFNRIFAVEIVNGRPYLDNLSYLLDVVTALDVNIFQRDPELARFMMTRNMVVSREDARKDLLIPSALLFIRRGLTPDRDRYFGMSTERVYTIPTREGGDVPFLYWSTRAFYEKYRGMEFGTKSAKIARAIHRPATWGGHRTMLEIAVRAMQKSKVFKEGRFFPWDELFDTDRLARQILNGLFDRVALNGRTVDQQTGVSRNDYYEVNRANPNYDPNHPSLIEICKKMRGEFLMQGTDSVYGVGEFK